MQPLLERRELKSGETMGMHRGALWVASLRRGAGRKGLAGRVGTEETEVGCRWKGPWWGTDVFHHRQATVDLPSMARRSRILPLGNGSILTCLGPSWE